MSVATLVEPACLWVPPGGTGTYGDDVGEVAERLGRKPEPEQQQAIDALVAHDARGRFLSVEAGVEGPRQSTGKTGGIMLPVILWTCLTDADLVTWTSHLADTHIGSFHEVAGKDPRDEAGLIVSNDWLRRRVRSVSYENGAEGISWTNGAQLNFRCRSARAGRGRSGATTFMDEWLFGDVASMGALLPSLATRSLHGNARAYYASSAPLSKSAHLWSLRRRALAKDPTLTYVAWWARGSWSDPGCEAEGCSHEFGTVEGCSLDNEALWAESNILLGRRTSVEFLRTMRRTLTAVEFGREFMGWGEAPEGEGVDAERWDALTDPQSTPLPSPLALSLEVAPKGASAAVLAAGIRADGLVHVEVVAHAPGTSWLAELLLAKQAAHDVPIHYRAGRTHTRSVVPALEAAGVRLEPMSLADYAAGCGGLDELMESGGIRHRGDPRLKDGLGRVVRKLGPDGTWVMTWSGTTGDASTAMALPTALRALAASTDYDPGDSVY